MSSGLEWRFWSCWGHQKGAGPNSPFLHLYKANEGLKICLTQRPRFSLHLIFQLQAIIKERQDSQPTSPIASVVLLYTATDTIQWQKRKNSDRHFIRMDHGSNYVKSNQDQSMNPHPCNATSRIAKCIKTEKKWALTKSHQRVIIWWEQKFCLGCWDCSGTREQWRLYKPVCVINATELCPWKSRQWCFIHFIIIKT